MLTEPLLLVSVLFAMILPGQLSSGPPGMLVSDRSVDVSVGVVVYVGFGVVVLALEDGQVLPPAAYPKSARKRMKMMNPKAVSVASSAMLCLDQYCAKHLLTIAFPIKRRAKQLLSMLCVDQNVVQDTLIMDRNRRRCQAEGGSGYDTETLRTRASGACDEDSGQSEVLVAAQFGDGLDAEDLEKRLVLAFREAREPTVER
jgi:hypothetical protein